MFYRLFLLFVVSVFSFQSYSAATPSFLSPNILNTLNSVHEYLESSNFNSQSCESLSGQLDYIRQLNNPEFFDLSQARRDLERIMDKSFAIKNTLRNFLNKKGSTKCIKAIREALVIARYFEDYFLVTMLEPKPFNSKTDPKAGSLLMGNKEVLQTLGSQNIKLKSGDVLLSRGNAYTSAAIARIGDDPAQFSHLSQVYIDAPIGTEISVAQALKDPRVYTVEAHIEVGSFIRTFGKYAQDGNARILLFRFKGSQTKAHYSARYIFDYVNLYQQARRELEGRTTYTVNDNPPYDFAMNMTDRHEIFCSEIVAMAYRSQKVSLPVYPTTLKVNDLTRTMGIKARNAFAPSDIEIDPNFQLIAEWRDLRKIPALLKKDVVLSSMFEWADKLNYKFHYNLLDFAKAQIAWTARQLDLGFAERLPKNMEKKVVRMTFAIDRVGKSLEQQLEAYEQEQFRQGRRFRPTFPEQMKLLEKLRQQDRDSYNNKKSELPVYGFHGTYRP